MSELTFAIGGAEVLRYAVSPQIALRTHVAESTGVDVHAITLRAQVTIEPQRRRYAAGESALLTDLFGGPERYGDTLRPLLWQHVAQTVLPFRGEAAFDLPLACSYDFEVAAHKYLSALTGGDIPLIVMFSGTVFVRGATGVATEFVPWTCEARYRLPVRVWREAMDTFFPNSAWLRLDRETFDELHRFKIAGGYPTWEAAIARLCAEAKAPR